MQNEKRTFYATCDNCGASIYEDDYYTELHNGYIYCSNCDNELIEYEGEYYDESECIYTRDDGYIPERICWDYYSCCEDCGEWINSDYIYWVGDHCYCDNCYDGHHSCGRLIRGYHDTDGFYPIKATTEKNASLFGGVELEVEPVGYNHCNREMLETITDNIPCYLEHDSSLDEGGFEIVTQPMSEACFLEKRGAVAVALNSLIDNEYGSNGNAGLHVHITRPATNDTEIVNRIWLIMENYKNEIIELAGRHSTGWAAFLSDNIRSNKRGDELYKKCMLSSEYIKREADKTGTRYLALNNTNYKTIEFRIFDHTTDIEELYARLELCFNITRIASNLSIDLTTLSFDDIINYNKDFTDLINYCNNNGISNAKKMEDNTLLYKAYKKRIEDRKKAVEDDIKKLALTFKASLIRNTRFEVNLKQNDLVYYTRLFNELSNVLSEVDRLLYQLDNSCYSVYDYRYVIDNIVHYSLTPKYYVTRFNKLNDKIKEVM